MAEILDSGERRVFETGAHRDRVVGKGAFNQLPYNALLEVAKIYEAGGIKYTPNNWKLGMPLSEFANSAIRHSIKAAQGWTDENHPAMAAWNWLGFLETRWMIQQGHLPQKLDDIHDWLSKEGAAKAMEQVKAENQAKTIERIDGLRVNRALADLEASNSAWKPTETLSAPMASSIL